jgi:hypothetical protein
VKVLLSAGSTLLDMKTDGKSQSSGRLVAFSWLGALIASGLPRFADESVRDTMTELRIIVVKLWLLVRLQSERMNPTSTD